MQHVETAMAGAMKKAGLDTLDFELRRMAQAALDTNEGYLWRALPTFRKLLVESGRAGLLELALRPYLEEFASHPSYETHAVPARDAAGTGQPLGETRHNPVHPGRDNSTGQSANANRSALARGNASGAGQNPAETQVPSARPVRDPSPGSLKAAAAVAQKIARTLLDDYKVRDGRSIGDVRFGELDGLWTASYEEAFVLRQIKRKYAHAAHDAKVRDLIKADELKLMKQRAAELAEAV